MKYPSYPKYKPSGIPWLGDVPDGWIESPLKYITTLNDEVLLETTDVNQNIVYIDISSVDEYEGVILKTQLPFGQAPSRARRLVRTGDIIVSTVRTYLRAIAKILKEDNENIVSTGFAVIRCKKICDSAFLYYLISSEYFMSGVICNSVGVSYPAINASTLVGLTGIFPPLPEQQAIAAFLDRETKKIDGLIAEQQRLIDLITEKRQALISHAVTRGLNPDAPMKSSGVDWLGNVPRHWRVKKLGYLAWVRARLGWKGLKAEEYVNSGYALLATPNIKDQEIDFANVNYITKERYDESPEIQLSEGDILLAKDGSTLGTVNFIKQLPYPATVNSSIAVITPNNEVFVPYLFFLFNSAYLKNLIQIKKDGMGVPHLFQEDINRFKVTLPPINEQKDISFFLNREIERLDLLTAEAERGIELLKERRSALISAAVTGKICVVEHSAEPQREQKREANPFFRRSVFAAEIVERMHHEPTFGHVKMQKMLFLAENICNIDLATHYHRDAAGPYDSRTLRSVDSQLLKLKWFRCEKLDKGYRYVPLENEGKHRQYFERYFLGKEEQLAALCQRFMTANTEQCEIVATLYSAWKDLLAAAHPSDDQIIDEVLNNWHPSKQRIPRERWQIALGWMREKNLCPLGGAVGK